VSPNAKQLSICNMQESDAKTAEVASAAPPHVDDNHTVEGISPCESTHAELIEAQRQLVERVPTVREHFVLGKGANGCRIDDFNSAAFKVAGPAAALQRRKLVDDAAGAIRQAKERGYFEATEADAVVDQFIVAACNELYPSEDVEVLFGLSEPAWEEVANLFGRMTATGQMSEAVDEASVQFDEATVGLLVFRTWKVLLRTPIGRAVLLAGDASKVDTIEPEVLNSFSAVKQVLSQLLVEDQLCTQFKCWVASLPVSKVAENTTLSPKEQSYLHSAIANGHVDWHSSKASNSWHRSKHKDE